MNSTMVPWGTRLSQLLDDALFNTSGETGEWAGTHANVAELDDRYEISLDLPGLESEDFQVEYEDGQLRISGERKFEKEEEGRTYHRVERRYGKFARAFALPRDVDGEKIEARYERGVLLVSVPKAESAKPRKIEVK